MRKPKLLAIMLSGFLVIAGIVAPQAAFADPAVPAVDNPNSAAFSTASEDEEENEDEAEDEDDESEDEVDEDEQESEKGYGVRPIKPKREKVVDDPDTVIDESLAFTTSELNELRTRFGSADAMELPPLLVKPKVGGGFQVQSETADLTEQPELGQSINLENISRRHESPASEFFEKAQVGLVAMGAGAIALGAVATTRAVRARKNKSEDYFYGESD